MTIRHEEAYEDSVHCRAFEQRPRNHREDGRCRRRCLQDQLLFWRQEEPRRRGQEDKESGTSEGENSRYTTGSARPQNQDRENSEWGGEPDKGERVCLDDEE